MNNEGVLDKKDLEILRLEELINKYKQYDNYRKKYYSKSLIELGELKSYTLELENILNNKEDKKLLYNQRKELNTCNKTIFKYTRKVAELEKEIIKLKEIISSTQ